MTDKKNPVKINMKLKDYVDKLDDSRVTNRQKFRMMLAELICCSPVTITQKIRENRWNPREMERIAEYLQTPIEILFPDETI